MDCDSPSLDHSPNQRGPAYELKFAIPEEVAKVIEGWAVDELTGDLHGDPALNGAYRTTSLYLDTPGFDVYYRSASYKRKKYRIRLYGNADTVFFERKTRSGDEVKKKRTSLRRDEVTLLGHNLTLMDWPGHWFHRRVREKNLGPACLVSYQRQAFFGSCPDGALRLTMDRHIQGVPHQAWNLEPVESGIPILPGQVILEFKFRTLLPPSFQRLVQEFHLCPTSLSKYRLCRDAWLPTGMPRTGTGA